MCRGMSRGGLGLSREDWVCAGVSSLGVAWVCGGVSRGGLGVSREDWVCGGVSRSGLGVRRCI